MVSLVVGKHCPKIVLNLSLPDEPVITGNSKEGFAYYKLDSEGMAEQVMEVI